MGAELQTPSVDADGAQSQRTTHYRALLLDFTWHGKAMSFGPKR